jgi:anti-sigma factor RsiW
VPRRGGISSGREPATDTGTDDELACSELVELVTDYLEGALAPAESARLEAHLDDCEGCRIHLAQVRRTIEVVGALTEESIPKEARDDLLAVFRSWKLATRASRALFGAESGSGP